MSPEAFEDGPISIPEAPVGHFEVSEVKKQSLKEWINSFYDRFDHSFMFIFIMSYSNLGFLVFFLLEFKDYGKHYMGFSAEELQVADSMFFFPWTFKLAYGLVSDSFTIGGYRRKYYIVICGCLGTLSILFLVMPFSTGTFSFFACGMLHMAAFAFNDVLVDSIMCYEAKKDPVRGSEDLQSLGFAIHALCGVLAAIVGAFFTQYVHPKLGLSLYSVFGVVIAFTAYHYNDPVVRSVQMQGRLGHALGQLKLMTKALLTPMIFKVFLFMFVSAAIIPRFHQFKYYYLIDVLGFSELEYGLLYLVTFGCMFLIVYASYLLLQRYSYRQVLVLGLSVTIITTFFDYLLYRGVTSGAGPAKFLFLLLTNLFEDFINLRYIVILTTVICARVTPNNIEASIFSFLIGISNFGFGVAASFHGNFWAGVLDISQEDMGNMDKAMLVKMAFCFVPFAMVPWIPNKDEIANNEELKDLNEGPMHEEKLIDDSRL